MLSIILIYVVPLLRKYLLPHIYKHMPFCNFSLYLKKAGLASRNIVHLNFNSTLYRSLLQSLQFIFVKPIRSTIDPTYTSRIFVHGCLLGHYSSPEPIASFSRRRLGTLHEGLWRHDDSRTSGLHVLVIKSIQNTVRSMTWRHLSGQSRHHIRGLT